MRWMSIVCNCVRCHPKRVQPNVSDRMEFHTTSPFIEYFPDRCFSLLALLPSAPSRGFFYITLIRCVPWTFYRVNWRMMLSHLLKWEKSASRISFSSGLVDHTEDWRAETFTDLELPAKSASEEVVGASAEFPELLHYFFAGSNYATKLRFLPFQRVIEEQIVFSDHGSRIILSLFMIDRRGET